MQLYSNGWSGVFEFPYRERNPKPRVKGQTMVIDNGLGMTETKEMLETAANYIDYVKLGFGTSALYSFKMLQEKINLVKSYGVDIYPGGTFFEIAVLQEKLEDYLERAKELGFTCIEVSNGTIEMDKKTREKAINRAQEYGFKVLSEVGKKVKKHITDSEEIVAQIKQDVECGVIKVIIEGRESGEGVVIYNKEGNIRMEELEAIVEKIEDYEVILWEAPQKNQQYELIKRLGPNVSLGNVHPEDVLALEAMRLGLRRDLIKSSINNRNQGNLTKSSFGNFFRLY